jgi:hypothetical protein
LRRGGAAAAAVVQGPDINKGTYTFMNQSTMSLVVIDFTFLEGRDNEIVVKELAIAHSRSNRVSSYVFKKPYCWSELPNFTAKLNSAITHTCNWDDGYILYSDLQTVLHREVSSAVAIYCFGYQKTNFISGLIGRTVIDITELGCPDPSDISGPSISCTFACHNKHRYVCALRAAHSFAQWLDHYGTSLQHVKCPPQPEFH